MRPKFIAGVTGTNGKTSVSYMAYLILKQLNVKVGYIGTNGVLPDVGYCSNLTTPDPAELHFMLDQFAADKITHVIIEISSAALKKKRAYGLNLDVAVFTSFAYHHIDANQTQSEYWEAKLSIYNLLRNRKNFFLSVDVAYYMNEHVKSKNKCYRYSVYNKKHKYQHPALMGFMIDNLQAACTICEEAGYSEQEIKAALLKTDLNVPGRIEIISETPKIIVDYASTPEALESLLGLFKNEKKILVFGCSGSKDIDKRSLMAQIAAQHADIVIVTDNNPNGEDASKIRRELMVYCNKGIEQPCRYEAIKMAIQMAFETEYTCIIAGKGHEKQQDFGDHSVPFSDIDVAHAIIRELKKDVPED